MNLFSSQNLIQMLYMLIPIILALSVHEFAHAFVADKMGGSNCKNFQAE